MNLKIKARKMFTTNAVISHIHLFPRPRDLKIVFVMILGKNILNKINDIIINFKRLVEHLKYFI